MEDAEVSWDEDMRVFLPFMSVEKRCLEKCAPTLSWVARVVGSSPQNKRKKFLERESEAQRTRDLSPSGRSARKRERASREIRVVVFFANGIEICRFKGG